MSAVISVLCKPRRPTISHATAGYILAESGFFIGKLFVLPFCLQHTESLGLIRFVLISGCQFGGRIEQNTDSYTPYR